MKVVVHAHAPFESCVENPLGNDGAPHRMWTWPDGSWLLVRLYDDGCARATTSAGIAASVSAVGEVVHVQVAPVRRALRRTPTAENELV